MCLVIKMAHYKKQNNQFLITVISVALAIGVGIGAAFLLGSIIWGGEEKPVDDNNPPAAEGGEQQPENPPEQQVVIPYETRVGKNYTIDIEQYLEYIEPENKYEYVFLVNPANTLASDYVPEDLTDCGHTRNDGRAVQKLRLAAAKALQAFLAEGKATGEVTNVTVTSAYRSYDYQDYLFKTYFDRDWASGRFKTKEECEKYTLSYSTKPGTSEHQSGLCLDMHNLPSAEESFKYKPEAKWLAENCYRFGFILRYPEGKTDITKITYEPWHFRFVGRDAATEMHELGLTLDEYVPLKKSEIDANK